MSANQYRLPSGIDTKEDYAALWARELNGGEDFRARILGVLDGAAPAPLFDEDQAPPVDKAGEHYWFLVNLAAVLETPADEPPCLPIPVDVSANPIATLARRGNPVARLVYSGSAYEKEWPALMQDLDLTSDALAFVGAILRRHGKYSQAYVLDALEELVNPRFHSHLSFGFEWRAYRQFWRRAHYLEGGAAQ